METERLVSYLYQVKGYIEGGDQTLQTGPIGEIINALRKSRRYKEYTKYAMMWSRLKKLMKSGEVYTLLPGRTGSGINITAIVKAFETIEQRYSPKSDRERTIKLVKELDKDVRALLRELGGI